MAGEAPAVYNRRSHRERTNLGHSEQFNNYPTKQLLIVILRALIVKLNQEACTS